MTGGAAAGGMAGMDMGSPGRGETSARVATLAAAHADVEAGRFDQALPVYQRMLRDDPQSLDALIHHGIALAGTEQVEQGLAQLDRALAMDGDNLHALWSKAEILFERKRDYAASIPIWERIAALAASSPDAATARGYVLRARERLEGGGAPVPSKGGS